MMSGHGLLRAPPAKTGLWVRRSGQCSGSWMEVLEEIQFTVAPEVFTICAHLRCP